jgi:hypothetical protein
MSDAMNELFAATEKRRAEIQLEHIEKMIEMSNQIAKDLLNGIGFEERPKLSDHKMQLILLNNMANKLQRRVIMMLAAAGQDGT